MVEAGATATDYFSDQQSKLILTIGDNNNDSIIFRSEGTATNDLVRINQTDVEILGNLVVSGTTTTVNSTVVDIADNALNLNSNASGAPSLDAYLNVVRGTSATVAVRWNESNDQWELTNDGTTYSAIVTSGGSGSIALSMQTAYDGGSVVNVSGADVDWNLSAGKAFKVYDGTDASKFVVNAGSGANSVSIDTTGGFSASAVTGISLTSAGGMTVSADTSVTGTFGVTGDTTLTGALTQSDGAVSLTAGTNAASLSGAAVSIDGTAASHFTVTGGALTLSTSGSGAISVSSAGTLTTTSAGATSVTATGGDLSLATATSGNISLTSVGSVTATAGTSLTLADVNTSLTLTNTNATALSTNFVYNAQTDFDWTTRATGTAAISSFVGALNANRDDLYQYVELISTQGAAVGTAAGANLVGVDGITGVIPTGKTAGDSSNLQEMLEGIAMGAGGGKTYADITAFTSAKSGGTYFKLNEPVYILDINRWVIVETQSTATVEGTDYDYVAGANRNIAGANYQFNLSGTGATSFDVTTAGGVTIAASGAVSVSGVNVGLTASGTTTISSTGAITMTGPSATMTAQTGNYAIAATSGNISLTATSGSVSVSGSTIGLDGTAASHVNVTNNNLSLTTSTSGNVNITSAGEINLQDSRTSAIPFSDASNTTLPGTATSLLGALKTAYEGSIDIGYSENTVTSTDVTNDYIVPTASTLPSTGLTFPIAPSALRTAGYYVQVYLNGLRLADTEWNYNYTGGAKQITFNGTDDITLVVGDRIAVQCDSIK
jgi:hypothetical protein